ncbi:hypothetical protein [Citrobacter freundii]|uniref:hypothetical protein n=1 Tax=Citrobacter freundii TaxID=546 RepID=UPI0028BF0016|nr:hypothetical protein [Citrobacter freundii]MDT7328558.1 hypothetical protein [Citrobacter freundii]MDT7401322.1 hypothetical protein [Citrobacter freundii]MDV1745371.1 hypothetical protein [Citrobacter freundii]MEB0443150.1 hypothetical protein [Citrobacter freundii]
MISESVISAAVRAQQAEDGKVGNCGRVWHVAFFFDGVGRNIVQDAPTCRLSNIARLFRAYPDEYANRGNTCFNKFYFSGMGTAYKDDSVDNINSLMDISLDNLLEDMKNLPEDTISDAGESVIKGDKKWTDVLGNLLEDLNNPVEWAKGIGKLAVKAAGKAGIESTPWLRDHEAISAYFMTGEPIRLEAAKKQFEKFYTENMKGSVPVKKFLSHYMVLIWEQHWHVNFWIIFFRNFARKIKKEYISIRMYLLILLSSGFLIAHAIRQPVVTTGWTIFLCGWVYRET